MPYAWQAAAAIYAAYARREDPPPAPAAPRLSRAEIAARAVDNGDAHVIKLVDTLLVEHALRPEAVYLAAAEDVLGRL